MAHDLRDDGRCCRLPLDDTVCVTLLWLLADEIRPCVRRRLGYRYAAQQGPFFTSRSYVWVSGRVW